MKKSFGREYKKEFPFEEKYLPLSHGSYGAYPKALQPIIDQYRQRAEQHPDRWNRFEVRELIEDNLKRAATLLRCDPKDLVFDLNASTAANNILRSFPFEEGDKILCYQTAYVNCDKTLEFLQNYKKVELVRINLSYPIEDDDVIRLTREAIERENAKESGKIRLCMLDVITSVPGVCKPYKSLVKLLKEYDILSLVDGAHSLGHVELNLTELDPDFFFANCHKWLFTPRGCTVLYVAKRNQGFIHPTVINYAFQHHPDPTDGSTFKEEHLPGVVDVIPFLCVGPALDYRESIGGEEAICEYNHQLAVEGGKLVANMLGTQVMENSTKTLTANMVNIELPIPSTVKLSDYEITRFFMKKSIFEHNSILNVYKNNGKWWVRLCSQIYLELDDFRLAGEIIIKLLKELEQ